MTRRLDQTQREHLARCIGSIKNLYALNSSIFALIGHEDAPLTAALRLIVDDYIAAVEHILGDRREWLRWYIDECRIGETPKTTTNLDGEKIEVKTLDDLIRVMEEFVP